MKVPIYEQYLLIVLKFKHIINYINLLHNVLLMLASREALQNTTLNLLNETDIDQSIIRR